MGGDSQNGSTALMDAARNGSVDCVRRLIDAGADTETRDNVRYSVLPPAPALLTVEHLLFFPTRHTEY